MAGTTYALRLFLRALPGWLSPRRSQDRNQNQGRHEYSAVRGKCCRYIGRGCGSLRKGIRCYCSDARSCISLSPRYCPSSFVTSFWFGTALSGNTYSWHARDARILYLSLPGCQDASVFVSAQSRICLPEPVLTLTHSTQPGMRQDLRQTYPVIHRH